MENELHSRIRPLLDRLQRLIASEDWTEDLNPAQRSALGYLRRANRFSRSPSQVADYLCTTRGTASQTLKALEKKGLIAHSDSPLDGRAISYEVTPSGYEASARSNALEGAISRMSTEHGTALEEALLELIQLQLKARQFRSFGMCNTCRYHKATAESAWCALLQVELSEQDAQQLCHEHSAD